MGRRKLTTEEFVKNAQEIHGDKYDYSLVQYENAKTPVTIICPIHGKFLMRLLITLIRNRDAQNVIS